MVPAVDPIALLRTDRLEAAKQKDPNANLCACATVAAGEPQVRTLVLREIEGRFGLFVNCHSPKHAEFAASQTVQVLVHLPSVAVQHRLTCGLEAMPSATVHASWRQRPPVPRKLDWLYAKHSQSSPIPSREWLLAAVAGAEDEPEAPASALGYYLLPRCVERLHLMLGDEPHDRRRYTLAEGGWRSEVLMP